jgi:hypothetical protein
MGEALPASARENVIEAEGVMWFNPSVFNIFRGLGEH